jgi:hypothetical protein
MPTKRTPIARQHTPPVSERAIKLFMQMQKCRRYSSRWWSLHNELHDLSHSKLWNWPCVEDPREGNPPGTYNHRHWTPNEEARALWRALDAGARELRRQERAIRRAKAEAAPATAAQPEQPPPT